MNILKKLIKLFHTEKNISAPEYPQSIILEPTNACNLKCRMCSVWGEDVKKSREVGFIKKDIWMNLFDEIGSWPVNINIDIHGAGEPLLHPDFIDILIYAKSKKNLQVGFLCNATLLDFKKAEAVIEAGIDWIGFSVDGAEKEIFEYYRRGASLSSVESNIETLIALKKNNKPNIFLNMVRHEEANIDLFIERWKEKVDCIQISIKRPIIREQNTPIIFKKPCPLIFQQLILGWSGHSVLCCEDCWGEYIIGKFPDNSCYQIWNSKAMQKARELHLKGKYDKINLCKHCDSAFFHEYNEMIIYNTRVRIELPDIKKEYGHR